MNDPDYRERVHPGHEIPAEVTEALAALRQEREANLAREREVHRFGRPTAVERRALAEGREGGAGDEARSKAARADFAHRVDEALRSESGPTRWNQPVGLPPFGYDPPPPPAADPNFWWAKTDTFGPPFLRADFLADGIHFNGRYTYDDGDLTGFSIGATSLFGIDSERLPFSSFGRWRSDPVVEMFGRVLGWTSAYDWWDGDSWCKVKLFRRQTVFQLTFGPTGPAMANRRENKTLFTLIDEENMNRARDFNFTGVVPMPSVEFDGIFPGKVWSELELRFDVQLEGSSLFHFDPVVIFRGLQWPALGIGI